LWNPTTKTIIYSRDVKFIRYIRKISQNIRNIVNNEEDDLEESEKDKASHLSSILLGEKMLEILQFKKPGHPTIIFNGLASRPKKKYNLQPLLMEEASIDFVDTVESTLQEALLGSNCSQ